MMFVHLQLSTAFSLLSSTISIHSLMEQAKKHNFSALAITDHNVLYGVLPFYKACIKAGIKPIIGMTAQIFSEIDEDSHSLVLLAKNNEGYKNLLKISSAIKTQQKEAISWKWLQAYSSGLMAITPGISGEIEQLLIDGQEEQAVEAAKKYKQLFANESFFLGLQNHGTVKSKELLEKIIAFSKEVDVPVVATNDVRYLERGDKSAYDTLIAIREGEKLADLPATNEHEHNFKSKQEMGELFADYPEALEKTLLIAERCNVMIETHQELLPAYPLPTGKTAAGLLKELCHQGLKERCFEPGAAYMDRLNYELGVIGRMGFNDYFLIVWDFMKYARDHGILTGPGRGSAAGSLVAYVLGITDVDPIEHGLLFERFLNPERISMPDIDIDFPDHRRDEVIEYVMNKYGKLHVAQIITFGTLAAKAAVRDTARAFGLNAKEMEQLSRLIPSRGGMTLERAYKESEGLRSFVNASEFNRKLFDTALTLEGLPRHASTHAAGVVISSDPLVNHIPIQGGQAGTYLTQFPMEDLEEIGLLKMDFLGLRNLSLLERVLKSVEIGTGKKIGLEQIPFLDEKTFAMLQKGETTGIFQLESEGMRKVLRELKPTEFEDIVAVNALYRPGPMENIPVYIARKHGKEKVNFPHPDLEPILNLTYGVIVYQEQIMQIASVMAGFSLGEADLLRRAVSKKKKDVLDNERSRFVKGAAEKGYDENIANETYDLIVKFANYGFNRSHAVAYSFIAWQLAWLKANYPAYFMAALLTSVIGNEDKISAYMVEAKHMGLKILPPSINKSHYPFTVETSGIRFSIAAIKGMGATALKELIQARKSAPFQDLFDFCMRVSPRAINRKLLEGLVHSGSFDEFGKDRAVLLATLDVAIEHAELMRPEGTDPDLFADEEMFQLQPKYVEVEPIGQADKLSFEKQAIGAYLSDHPASSYEAAFKAAGTVHLYELKPGQKNVSAGVYIAKDKTIRTKKGDVMAFVGLSDSTGEMEGVVFPDTYRRSGNICKEGEIVLISGNVEERDGNLQFIIQRIQKADQVESSVHKEILYLKIPEKLDQHDVLHLLKTILKRHSGETAVVLHYEKQKQTIKLAQNDWVNPTSSCLQELRQLLGENSVMLK